MSGAAPRPPRRQKTATSERRESPPARASHDTSLDEAFAAIFEELLDRGGMVPTLGSSLFDSLGDDATGQSPESAASWARDGSDDTRETSADPNTSHAANRVFGPDTDADAVVAVGASTELHAVSEMADGIDSETTVWDGGSDAMPRGTGEGESLGDLARRRREAWHRAAARRAELSPAAAAILADLGRQLDEEDRASLAGPGRCLLHLRENAANAEWLTAGSAALDVLLQTHALPGSDDPGSAFTDLIVFGGSVGKKGSHARTLTDVTGAFTRYRVVAVRESAETSSDVERLADVRLQVRRFDAASLAAALQHRFAARAREGAEAAEDGSSDPDPAYPACSSDEDAGEGALQTGEAVAAVAADLAARFDLTLLTPGLVDLSCGKASTAIEAEAILARGLAIAAGEARASHPSSKGPTLEALPGYSAVRPWAAALVTDLRLYAKGELAWVDVDPGALLAGPPGSGKTMLAGAIAASAGCRFIATSFAAWQSIDGGHLGSVTAAMRQSFAEARAERPTLLFIDELDSLPRRGSSRQHDDYWRAVTNCLLEELDGAERRKGLLVLAACNDTDALDPALLRSGRLDRVITVGMPTAQDVADILLHLMPELGSQAERLGALLAGTTTGADIARLTREARRSARRAKRGVTAADLMAIAMPPDGRPEPLRRRVALHEAGHAVAYMVAGRMPVLISIEPNAMAQAGGWLAVGPRVDAGGLRHEFEKGELLPMLCGRAAEEIILGEASAGAGGTDASDIARATALSATLLGRLGLGASLRYADAVDVTEVDSILRRAYADAQLLVLRHRVSIERLAGALLEKRVLTASDIADFARQERLAGSLHESLMGKVGRNRPCKSPP